ncbi:hypothetical protein TrVE_jg1767 [Triparma verrucosa]|uniref:DUF1569 domain-containing protein n=1 Tax=Triparma verrucosa TaxID=1606542 RepID=A0A9W7FAI2_9STRA|nr:hypothetical protein TrVE_jg1767 [Triparma verrucosa]
MTTPVRVYPEGQGSNASGPEKHLAALKVSAVERKSAFDAMNLSTALQHCTDHVLCSMSQYPATSHSNWLVKLTLGRLNLKMTLMKGAMTHDTDAFIPGLVRGVFEVKKLENTPEAVAGAVDSMIAALKRFNEYEGDLAEHFFYGKLTKDQYRRVHINHLYAHLDRFSDPSWTTRRVSSANAFAAAKRDGGVSTIGG